MAEEVKYDIDGYDLISVALDELINQYPALEDGERFSFATELADEGLGVFPTSGAIIQDERESITGHVTQMCQYPFTIVYRASGLSQKLKINAKEWLDTLGRWLEKQPIIVDGVEHKIIKYPELTGTRQIRKIYRQSPSYLSPIPQDKSEDWVIMMLIQYRNEFDK